MFSNILVFVCIVFICFVENGVSNNIALTGLKPEDRCAIQTSVTKDAKAIRASTMSLLPAQTPPPTSAPHPSGFQLAKRQSYISSCGDYQIPDFSLQLNMGQTCLVDDNGLMFGACSTRVTNANDCGWAGVCVDHHACTSTCGRTSVPNMRVTTCGGDGNDYCAMWYLVSQTYVYTSIVCSNHQSWSTFDAILVTTITDDSNGQPIETTQPPASTSTDPSTPTISMSNPNWDGNSTADTNPQDGGHSLGAIMGGVFGGLGFVLLLCFLVWFFNRRMESKHRASRALAYDPGSSSDHPEPPNPIGSPHAGSIHQSARSLKLTGGPVQSHEMGYMVSPLGSPSLEDGSVHQRGVLSPRVQTPVPEPSIHSLYVELPADRIPAELSA